MPIIKNISIFLSAIFMSINSGIVFAAESANSSSLPAIWPLLLFIAIVVVFRKQLNCVKPLSLKTEAPKKQTSQTETIINQPVEKNETVQVASKDSQCQAATAKGTRCKRTSMLESVSIDIDGKQHDLTICKQHNTKSLKPFSDFLK